MSESRGLFLRFDGKPLCDIHFRFKGRNDKTFATCSVIAGAREMDLPPGVARQLNMKKEVTLEMVPSDFFGDPQSEYTTKLILKR